MKYLKNKQYTDAKDFAGECEPVVVIAKGQSKKITPTNCLIKVLWMSCEHGFIFFYACRCARDMQVRYSGWLHTSISEFALQIRSGFVFGIVFERDFRSSHSESRHSKNRWKCQRKWQQEATATTETESREDYSRQFSIKKHMENT